MDVISMNMYILEKEIKKLSKEGVQVVSFPELSITGYTCGDLFKQEFSKLIRGEEDE